MRSNPRANGITKVYSADGKVIAIYPGRWTMADLPSKIRANADHSMYVDTRDDPPDTQ